MAETGKVALITGAASGLGKHLAETLQAEGATIIIADINEAGGKAVNDELNKKRAGSAYFHKVDTSEWDSQVQLFEFAVKSVPRIDYIFANAGIMEQPWLPPATTETKAGEPFARPDLGIISVNTVGTLTTANLAVQVFRRQERVNGFRGKLIVTTSAAGIYAMPQPLYCSTKYSLVGLVRAMAMQHFSEGITVNGIAPTATRSNILPKEVWDMWDAQGWVTPNATVSKVFMSYLGNNKENGLIKEISLDYITIRLAPKPEDPIMTAVLATLNQTNADTFMEDITSLDKK